MTAVLSKSADRIGPGDIQALVVENVPESAWIAFKASLPVEGSDDPDPCMQGDGRIGDRARNETLEEVVAFANGGAMVLDITEDGAKPRVAVGLTPLSPCTDLGERFRDVFHACVEPQLPVLETAAIRTAGDDGIVVLRAGRSRRDPRRAVPTLKCTVRRNDRCESLSTRGIQDMTLNLALGTERLERRLCERSKKLGEGVSPRARQEKHSKKSVTAIRDGVRFL